MMTKDKFHETLREFIQRDPFIPFVVDLTEGRQILVKRPPVVFCDGAASFIDLDGDGGLVDFFHDEVAGFRPVPQEVGS